jgi:branched-chain amino acid transport system permease protein
MLGGGEMADLLVEIVRGVATGCIYALLALGLTLIYQVSGVVNFAQGALAAAGAYGLWSLLAEHGVAFWPAVLMTLSGAFLLGALLQVVFLQRLQRSPAASLIVTLGLLIVLEGGIGLVWGYSGPTPPLVFSLPFNAFQEVSVGTISLTYLDLASIGVTAGLIFLFFAFLRYTTAGASLRAVAQSATGAQLVGIRVWRVRLIAWGISAAIAGVAGVLIATSGQQAPTMAEVYLLNAFAGAVIGGLDNLPGAALGALLVGVVQDVVALYMPTDLTSLGVSSSGVVFLILLIVLLVRPAGLFGRTVQSRV